MAGSTMKTRKGQRPKPKFGSKEVKQSSIRKGK